MEEENRKMGFFTKLKTSITKLEEYDRFLGQKFSEALGYFTIIILIISAIISLVYTYEYSKQLEKGICYIKNELPDFSYKDATFKSSKNVEAYDDEYKVRLFINSDDNVSEETIKEYDKIMYNDSIGIIILKDRIRIVNGNLKEEYIFSELQNKISGLEEISISSKQDLINMIDSVGMNTIVSIIYIENLITLFITEFIQLFLDMIMVAIFGSIACSFARVRCPGKTLVILAIYSVTFPNILHASYMVLNLLTGFYIKYFSIFYMLISCVYIFTAIFMIKSDIIRQQQELQMIAEVQKQVKEEAEENLEEESKEKEEKNTDEKKDDSEKEDTPVIDENNEPDGSEI